MTELRIDIQKVSHIRINDLKASGYIWLDEIPVKRVFFNLIVTNYGWKEGYYWGGNYSSFSNRIKKLENNMVDIGGEIHYLPCISIFCGETKLKTKYFKDLETAKRYCDNNFPNVNLII